MIVVDTSIWIHHFRESNPDLCQHLAEGQVATHPFVIGELACGNLPRRKQTLEDLKALPDCKVCLDHEVRESIERNRLMGNGLGYIDVHLLASCLISGFTLWTRDLRLRKVSQALGCA